MYKCCQILHKKIRQTLPVSYQGHDVPVFSANLFINEGNIVIGDFGLSKYYENKDSRIMSDLYMGSELYLPPESKSETPVYTFESDIYSLGIIYIQLFSQCQSLTEFISIFKTGIDKFNLPHKIKLMLSDEPSKRPKINDL